MLVFGVLLPFVSGAALAGLSRVGRGAKRAVQGAAELERLAKTAGKTAEEMEVLLARVGQLPPDARAQIRQIEQAIENGLPVDPARLERLSDELGAAGLGRLPATDAPLELAPGPRIPIDAEDPRVRAPADVDLPDAPAPHGDQPITAPPRNAPGAIRGKDVYPPRTFEKDGELRISTLNAQRVNEGVQRAARRPLVNGATSTVQDTSATAAHLTVTVPTDGGAVAHVKVTVELKPDLGAARVHKGEAGPARLDVRRDGPGWVATVELDNTIHPDDLHFVLGHELDEISEIVTRHPSGTAELTIEREMKASIMRPGSTAGASTAHDVAVAHELVGLAKDLQNLRRTGSPKVAHREAVLERALRAAGLDDPLNIDLKLKLLRQAGAPTDLLERVELVEARRALDAHRQYMGSVGTVFDEALVHHVEFPDGTQAGGVSGGHHTQRLLALETDDTRYAFREVRRKAAGGTTYRKFEQYRWIGPQSDRPLRGSGMAPGEPSFDVSKWTLEADPKTTADDVSVLLREAEGAFSTWRNKHPAIVASPTGSNIPFTELSPGGVEISGFVDPGPPPRVTTLFVEASWF